MKHSDINHSENTFVNSSNSNAVMRGPVISTPLDPNSSTILNKFLNTSQYNLALLSKPDSLSSPSVSLNMVGHLTYLCPNTNAIKLESMKPNLWPKLNEINERLANK